MKKTILAFLAACIAASMTLALASCGGEQPADSGSGNVSASDSVEESASASEGTGNESTSASDESIGGDVADEIAPVISIEGDPTSLEAKLGEPLELPAATATDEVDGEVDVIVFSDTQGAVKNGVFTTDILGVHTVTYYATDEAENETFVDIEVNVSSDTVKETADVTGYNDISALAEDGGIFKENFEKGLNSPLIKKALQGEAVVMASENTVSGNSLVLDYSKCVGKENRIFLTNVMPYFRSGEWTVSFDVKLVEGTPFSDFYFGYVKDGTVTSKDQNIPLTGMKPGDVKRVEWKQLLDLDDGADYFFHIFRYSQEPTTTNPTPFDQILAFDNFEFRYVEKVYRNTVPTVDQLKEGFTYNWSSAYTSIGGAAPVRIDEIEDATVKAAIEGAGSGFGNTVMHLTGSGAHDVSSIVKSVNADFYQTGWTYVFEITYYAVSAPAGGHYLIAYDGTPGNKTVKVSPFASGLHTATIEYTVSPNDTSLTFYGSMDVYLGEFRITYSEPDSGVREDYHTVTADEMRSENGYTFDWSENNLLEVANNVKYVKISSLSDASLKSALQASGAYANDYAMKYYGASSSFVPSMNGMFVVGNVYEISFDAYNKTAGSITVLLMNSVGQQAYESKYTTSPLANGLTHYTTSFVAREGYYSLNLYIVTECEIYLANFTIKETEEKPVSEEDLEDRVVTLTRNYGDLKLSGSKFTEIDTPAYAADKTGFDDKCLRFVTAKADYTMELFRFTGFPSDSVYPIKTTFVVCYYVEEISGAGLYINLDNSHFEKLDASEGYHEVTIEVNYPSIDFVSLYVDGSTTGTFLVGRVTAVAATKTEKA